MYALVQFLVDKVKAIVPVSAIKNFDHNSYEVDFSQTFQVFWKAPNGKVNGYRYAVVLLVAETEILIEKREKRVKFPSDKRLEKLLAKALDDEAKKTSVNEETRSKIKETEEKQKACEREKLLDLKRKQNEKRKRSPSQHSDDSSDGERHEASEGPIIRRVSKIQRRGISSSRSDRSDGDNLVSRSELKKLNQEYIATSPSQHSDDSSDEERHEAAEGPIIRRVSTVQRRGISTSQSDRSDGDNLVSRSELKKLHQEYNKIFHKLQLKKEENNLLKQRNDQLQDLNVSLQKLNVSLQTLNVSLQNQGLSLQNVNAGFRAGHLGGAVDALHPGPAIEGDPQHDQELPVQGFLMNVGGQILQKSRARRLRRPRTQDQTQHSGRNLLTWEDDKIELAPGIILTKDQWKKITTGKNMNESRLTRNLAVSLWGSDTLLQRSVTGAVCRRYIKDGVKPKAPLTPVKVDAVQNGLRYWLIEHQRWTEEEAMRCSSLTRVRKLLAGKIMDVVKTQRRIL